MNDNTPLPAWHNHRLYFFCAVNGCVVMVDADLYQHTIREEFTKRGLKFKTWNEYVGEWNQQCVVEGELRSQITWEQMPGVQSWAKPNVGQ